MCPLTLLRLALLPTLSFGDPSKSPTLARWSNPRMANAGSSLGSMSKRMLDTVGTLLTHIFRPNQVGQSDMSPQDGAALWIEKIEPLRAKGCKLVSPATTSAPSGKQWLKDFLDACNGRCTVRLVRCSQILC